MTSADGRPDDLVLRLVETFVRVADVRPGDIDVSELLHVVVGAAVALLDFSAGGLLLAGRDGALRVAAASDEESLLLEVLQAQEDTGPCEEAVRSGTAVVVAGAEALADRWPRFARAARAVGLRGVCAVPLRWQTGALGSLNLFDAEPRARSDADVRIAQALADLAAVTLEQARSVRRHREVAEQLQHALESRVVIEQAKGVVAEAHGLDMTAAFSTLLRHARNNNHKLTDVARRVVQGELPAADLRPG